MKLYAHIVDMSFQKAMNLVTMENTIVRIVKMNSNIRDISKSIILRTRSPFPFPKNRPGTSLLINISSLYAFLTRSRPVPDSEMGTAGTKNQEKGLKYEK